MDVLMPLVFAAIILVAGIKLLSLALAPKRLQKAQAAAAEVDRKFWSLVAHFGKEEKK